LHAPEAWVRAHLEGVRSIELVHEEPWGVVWCVLFGGGVAWFKAPAPIQAFEPRLTAVLALRWPELLPEVLAHEEERGWLLLGDAGEPLGFSGEVGPWLAVLPRYAELQRGEAAHAAEHLAGGVPDRRLATFPELYEAMLAHELPVADVELTRLRTFAPRFAGLCRELASHGLPETMQHDDLHGANVYRGGGALRILDWGDSCVSHPFLTSFVTFLHLEELGGIPPDDASFARLRDAYLEPWGRPAELRETFELALRLGVFAHVFKELHVFDAIAEEERPAFTRNFPSLLARCVAATE
jgi:hypothetical protein